MHVLCPFMLPYTRRVFPGQDPSMVYVGWVTTQYHLHTQDFNRKVDTHTEQCKSEFMDATWGGIS